jgi:DNA-binding SARP family transcriptional activator
LRRLQYLILGPLDVRDGDDRVELRGGQQRKLLAILLLHAGEAVSSDRLIDELWHGEPPDTAGKALQGYVSSLRKQLGQDAIETIGAGYRLSVADEDLDARNFEELLSQARPLELGPAAAKLREALGLWRGPALADLAYEDFAQHEIERLGELRLSAVERRIDLDLALGHHDDLVPELEALVHAHPLRERFRGQLMVAFYRSGRQADALEAYQDARTVLRDELGLEPSEELQGLQRAILDHDPSLTAPPRVEPPPPAVDGRPSTAQRLRRPLVAIGLGLAILGGVAVALALTLRGGPIVVPKDSVAMVDQAGTKVESYYTIGRGPVAVAVGFRSVWAANAVDESVVRLTPAKQTPPPVPVAVGKDFNDIAVGFRSVWVAGGNSGTVTRIDPTLDEVVHTFESPGKEGIGPDPVFFVAVDSRYVWATRGDELVRIDPATNVAVPVRTIGTPTGLATGGGSVWVTNLSQGLLRVNARTLQTESAPLTAAAYDPVYARRSVWLIYQHKIQQIDPSTLEPRSTLTVTAGYPTSLAADQGVIWAIDSSGALTRFAPRAGDDAVLHVAPVLSAVAAGGGSAWVAVRG